MRLVRIVSLNIHYDQLLLIILAQYNSPSCPIACFPLQDCKVSLEQMIEECTFASILGSDDGNGEVILLAIGYRSNHFVECFLAR
jgi:hypothetical protein